jgi:hypothetical protein
MGRKQKVERYGNAHHELSETLGNIPREMWLYKPSPNQWSIHEIIIHLADSEANGYIRIRKAIAEPGTSIMVYNQEIWASRLGYIKQSPDELLELFKWLRASSYAILRSLPEPVWQQAILHPERGNLTLEQLLDIYANHVPKHINQMKRIYEQWRLRPQPQNI